MIREYLFDVDPYEGVDLSGHRYNAEAFNMPYSVLDQVRVIKPSLVLEVGSWRGASAIHMANQLRSKHLSTEIVCIDTWLGSSEMWTKPERDKFDRYSGLKLHHGYPSVYWEFLKNVVVSGHKKRITPFPTTSAIGARVLASLGVQANLIYIDGSHDYLDVKADLEAYWGLLEEDGIMMGDDYFPDLWDVKRAVDDFTRERNLPLKFSEKDGGWMIYKAQAAIHNTRSLALDAAV